MEIFDQFNKNWALVTAGNPDRFNTMTVSWGGLGTLWSRPVATVYVRHNRYTFEFMNESDYFTVSFFPEEYRDDLTLLGRKSGRDGNKLAETKLTAVPVGESMGFAQAELTLLCKKLYWDDIEADRLPAELYERYYAADAIHRLYIGQVVDIIRK